MKVDLYDFDKTVFPCDSTTKFWRFCFVKNPKIIKHIPHQIKAAAVYFFCKIDLTYLKSEFLCFVKSIDVDKMAELFWDKNSDKIFEWFLPENRKNPAIVISASPEFVLKPICERLQVYKLIATKTDADGKIVGINCKGAEKVKRLYEEMSDIEIENVYSDSLSSDKYIFELGEKMYHTIKGEINLIEKL